MKNTISLKNTLQFKTVYNERKAKSDNYLIVFIRKNDTDINRLGISVSKKVGNSVQRHRLTRLIRESYRLHEDEFNSGLDIVVVGKQGANPRRGEKYYPVKCRDIERSLIRLAKFHKIYKSEKNTDYIDKSI
ncbi:MAG: ribonuclease P protein component [Lachnospiraceae bacterium]|nr:ribonuclease P protein component [Lachnospiraceae bacterium]